MIVCVCVEVFWVWMRIVDSMRVRKRRERKSEKRRGRERGEREIDTNHL